MGSSFLQRHDTNTLDIEVAASTFCILTLAVVILSFLVGFAVGTTACFLS